MISDICIDLQKFRNDECVLINSGAILESENTHVVVLELVQRIEVSLIQELASILANGHPLSVLSIFN